MFTHKTPRIGEIYSKMDERACENQDAKQILKEREREREKEQRQNERKEAYRPSLRVFLYCRLRKEFVFARKGYV